MALAAVLARLHQQAHAGIASFCAIDATFNCDRVATSRFSVLLGLPVAVWGAVGYALAAALAGLALGRRRRSTWPRGLLFVVAAFAVTASVALAFVSKFLIGAWCLLCAASWATSLALLVAAWRACRPPGVRAAVSRDLEVLRANPLRAATVAVVAVAGIALAAAAYPRYWERSAGSGSSKAPGLARGPSSPGAPAVVFEYSDYECPFCARAHFETKAALAGRPDIELVRRHFPLDPSCNPAVHKAIHPQACGLARVGICAEAQGRFAEMDDLLFINQEAKRPIEELVKEAGLDGERFRECLNSPATTRRLESDIAAGIVEKVPATPTFVLGKTVSVGRLPTELLPPTPSRPK